MIYRTLLLYIPRSAAMVLTSLVYAAAILAILMCMPGISTEFRYLAH